MKYVLLFWIGLSAQAVFASTKESWSGTGALFDLHGKNLGNYTLAMENIKNNSDIQSQVIVSLADGKTLTYNCQIKKETPDSWSSQCDHGKGGGRCLGEGLCISYEKTTEAGIAFATTIIKDGPSDLRLLRTELQNGQAVKFFREKLHKK